MTITTANTIQKAIALGGKKATTQGIALGATHRLCPISYELSVCGQFSESTFYLRQ
jgi:hypothetical protein